MGDLILTYRGVVYPWQCDHMGHMNVMYYVGKFDEATWQFLASIGITPTYMRDQKRSMVAAEQHITYKRELCAGDLVTVESGLVEIREKVVRFFHAMRNQESGLLAATVLVTGIHIDSEVRKSTPLPSEILAHARQMVAERIPED